MTSTTLMTFLLTTNPEIRSVKLLGSWDNFSRPYVMERDKRIGPGHWRGCHTFADIISDGPSNGKTSRTGGLKMGGTYWYYYVLDDDVEYYSQAEPVTTKCPLLPGQPVNVLNVPIILPDSRAHGRSTSSSSQKSDYRTMNPEDKFMNPRKPPKPNLARLQTSVPHPQHISPSYALNVSPTSGSIYRSASQPSSATRRNHHSKDARSVSPPRSRGLFPPITQEQLEPSPGIIAPCEGFQQKSASDDCHDVPGISIQIGTASSSSSRRGNSPPATIQSRRAIKANGGNLPQAQNLLTVETRAQHRNPSISKAAAASSNLGTVDETSAVKEALIFAPHENSSNLTTPTGTDVKEKRLPTLPNTPSSVMDEAVRAIDETDKAMNLEVLRSHFSSLTTVDDSTHSRFMAERSRFSEWSTDIEDNSPESLVSASTFNQTNESPAMDDWRTPELSQVADAATNTDPNTPHLTVHSKPSSPNSASGDIPHWLPQLTISLSSPLIDGTGLGIEQMDEVESNPKRHAALFSALESMEELTLSQSPNASPILLPHIQRESEARAGDLGRGEYSSRLSDASPGRNSTMQELMDELSYLKNMIHAEMDGEPF
ncbi:uncharacterized protein N7459_007554 [Penicillium hispanicum]|uniref:uncharacterized protein n=1 Tax=Penicillium hispanicum TaxID=1080232 RepID=UPI0025417FAC|nr:uncharacterized protein N7459_007554 [Penicillium hispanicum]KAJ5578590.1 hypothetical protein N7459_007554 [Penicillium hispanicum]